MTAILWAGDVGFLLLVLLSGHGLLFSQARFAWAIALLYVVGVLTFVRWAIDTSLIEFEAARIINSFTPWMALVALAEQRIPWRRFHRG